MLFHLNQVHLRVWLANQKSWKRDFSHVQMLLITMPILKIKTRILFVFGPVEPLGARGGPQRTFLFDCELLPAHGQRLVFMRLGDNCMTALHVTSFGNVSSMEMYKNVVKQTHACQQTPCSAVP